MAIIEELSTFNRNAIPGSGSGHAIGFVNTQCFREAAIHFNKYKKYDDGVYGTLSHNNYWNREIERCINGYETGGVRISGYHYFYLNYARIIEVTEVDATKNKLYGSVSKNRDVHARKAGDRKESFPAFWDVDYMYFTSLDIAEYGISDELYNALPIALNILPESRGGGMHLIWMKPRGVGASWKGGAIATRNFSLIRDSKTFMLASDKTFLNEDGLFNKFHLQNNWLVENAIGMGKLSEFKNEVEGMHYRASVKVNGREAGFMSEVIGVSLGNDPQKARGKRGKAILYEELGKFPKAHIAWNINRQSTEQLNMTFGTQIGFGTGGTEGSDFESIRLMFYDPRSYNAIAFDNVHDDIAYKGTKCCLFTPAFYDIGLIDANGNSIVSTTKQIQQKERDILQDATDPLALTRYKAEKPWTPQEAILETGKNIFITPGLVAWKNYLENSGYYKNVRTVGAFERVGFDLTFKPNPELVPIDKFPHAQEYKVPGLGGAVVMYHTPFKKNGKIPLGLYKICVDTYRHDETTGDSVGAVYVIEQLNNFTPNKGDRIVASYIGRPEDVRGGQEEFNKVLFELAEYYNAEIAFENDEPGDVIGYAKRKHKTHMLADEFQLAFDEQLKTSETSRRKFGIHMGSGKDNKRKKQGDLFIKNWLYTLRGYTYDADGNEKPVYNYHLIYDVALLEELCQYMIDANRDRVSALRVGVYHMRELEYNEEVPTIPQGPKDNFFERQLF